MPIIQSYGHFACEMADVRRTVVNLLSSVLSDLQRSHEAASLTTDALESCIFRLDQLSAHIVALAQILSPALANELKDLIGTAIECLSEVLLRQNEDRSRATTDVAGYAAPLEIGSNNRGRPRYAISQQQLEYFLDLGFDCPTIASMLGVHLRTVRRRMSDYGLHVGTYYSGITDDALDGAIQEIKSDFPAVGYRMTHGILIGRGIRVQVSRVREAMRRCDPEGVALRWLRGMHSRRVYSVHGPQALWHIDGNHKLIRYSLTAQFSAVDSVSTKCFTGGDLLSMVAWTVFLGCPFTFAAAQTIRLLQFYSIFFRPSMSTDCRLGLDVTKEAKITTLHGTC